MEKWSALAGLRFLLASIVAFNHLPDFAPLGIWAFVPMFGAFEAILGFLLISGFSIASSYMKEPEGYLWRRIQRIYPIYLASMLLAVGVYVLSNDALPSLWTLLVNVLFLNQVLTTTSFVGPAWSLSLEFWLYCLAPFLMTLREGVLVRLIVLSFASYCLYTCGRTLFHWNYYSGTGYGLNLLLLSFVWVAGLLLAKTQAHRPAVLKGIGLMFALHIALAAAIQFASRMKHGQLDAFLRGDAMLFAAQALTLAGVLWVFARVLRPDRAAAKASSFMRTLGDISYPLYLIHIPVYELIKRAGLEASPLLYYAAAVLASALMYRGLDFYSQRRHLRPAAAAPAAPDGSPHGASKRGA